MSWRLGAYRCCMIAFLLSIIYLCARESLVLRSGNRFSLINSQQPHRSQVYKGPFAVCTFLAGNPSRVESDSDDDDEYFIGARILTYQLRHAAQTKLQNPTPIVIIVTDDVRESKRQRLRMDGAIVVPVDHIRHNLAITEPRWKETVTKLRVFDPATVPYRKVLYMDTDIVLTSPVDAIFYDPSTAPEISLNYTENMAHKPQQLPTEFIMAASPESGEVDHSFPYADVHHDKTYFNSGFFVYSPNSVLFHHYLHLLRESRLWYHGFPDQDLLNYAHRWDGPMPWRWFHPSWHLNWPNDSDLAGGMVALHAKWWSGDFVSPAVQEYAFARRREMEGFWTGREYGV